MAHSGHSMLNAGCSQVGTWFSRARGGAFPSRFLPARRGIMFHAARAPMKRVYTRLAYRSRDLVLAGLLFSQRVVA